MRFARRALNVAQNVAHGRNGLKSPCGNFWQQDGSNLIFLVLNESASEKVIMTTEPLETRAEDGDFKFIFKTFGRKLSAEEAQQLCLKYRGEHIKRTLGHALEVDLRPAFEKPLDEVKPKFNAVPWKRDPLNP